MPSEQVDDDSRSVYGCSPHLSERQTDGLNRLLPRHACLKQKYERVRSIFETVEC